MKKKTFNSVVRVIKKESCIISARAYGSSMFNEKSEDVDIAVIVPSDKGIVDSDVYRSLLKLREEITGSLKCDIDIIPHTIDELEDVNSPLWYPRYNPSLVFGEVIKGKFSLASVTKNKTTFEFKDLTAYVLHDNRTICRRQIVRSLQEEAGRIFVSKLLHGPGNALTFYSCKNRMQYFCSPSDLKNSFLIFDEIYGADSSLMLDFLFGCKKEFDFEKGLKLMNWYEALVSMVFDEIESKKYKEICARLSQR